MYKPVMLTETFQAFGAYDARTVCHSVIVPFEMEVLKKALGGSNEPFLNKPARFPELNKNNAVRRGNDQAILNALCDNLPLISGTTEAYQCLVYLLCKLIKIRDKKQLLTVFTIDNSSNTPAKLWQYINEALKYSYEGEILTLMIAGVYHLRYIYNPDIMVEVHPVNQSGASGREVSDLDIYLKEKLISSNELKDKEYSEPDVRHAADKALAAGGTGILFIERLRAEKKGDFVTSIQNEYMSRNFMLRVLSYQFWVSSILPSLEVIDCKEFVRYILETARETKFKEEVINYLDELAQEIFGLKRN